MDLQRCRIQGGRESDKGGFRLEDKDIVLFFSGFPVVAVFEYAGATPSSHQKVLKIISGKIVSYFDRYNITKFSSISAHEVIISIGTQVHSQSMLRIFNRVSKSFSLLPSECVRYFIDRMKKANVLNCFISCKVHDSQGNMLYL